MLGLHLKSDHRGQAYQSCFLRMYCGLVDVQCVSPFESFSTYLTSVKKHAGEVNGF